MMRKPDPALIEAESYAARAMLHYADRFTDEDDRRRTLEVAGLAALLAIRDSRRRELKRSSAPARERVGKQAESTT